MSPRPVYVLGVSMTQFGKFPDRRGIDMGTEAVLAAIRDASIPLGSIQIAYCGHTRMGTVAGQRVLAELGLTGIEIVNVDNACASGSTALRGVALSIAHGMADVGLAFGLEQMSKAVSGVIPPREDDLEGALGRVMPSTYAMLTRRHMDLYGTTPEQLARVSVKNHKNGSLNPLAQYREPVTIEQVLQSRMIADPLTLLQCCPNGDGAAAVVLGTEAAAKKWGRTPLIRVAATTLRTGGPRLVEADMASSPLTIELAKEAYAQAGIGPEDLDVVELHDAFTIGELVHYENLGLCPRGEGGKFLDSGATELGGKVAVSPSGGLLSKGHPLGATGLAQVYEVVTQLRGEAGKRQQPDAKVGLTHTMGGAVTGVDSGACSIHIFTR